MKLTDTQLKQAMDATRALIKGHSTMFLDYNKMVSDEALEKAIVLILDSVEEETK